jgi:aminopeptidase S
VKVVGSTTTTVYEELGAASDDDAVWLSRSVSLNAYAGQTVRIVIEAADAGTASLVEAAVDDVQVTRQ